MSWLWSPCLGMRRQVRLCAALLLLVLFRQRHPRTHTVFVSRRLDIKVIKKVVARYKQIQVTRYKQDQVVIKLRSSCKINYDKSEGLQRRFGKEAFSLEWWTHPHPRGVVQARTQTGVKLVRSTVQGRCPDGYLASKAVVLKGLGGGVRNVYLPLDPLKFILPLPKNHRLALQWYQITLERPMVYRQVCCQRPSNGGLGMPYLENHWFAERQAYLSRSLSKDTVWRRKGAIPFLALSQTPKAEGQRLSSLWHWLRTNSWACLLLLRASLSVLEACRRVDGLYRTHVAPAARR